MDIKKEKSNKDTVKASKMTQSSSSNSINGENNINEYNGAIDSHNHPPHNILRNSKRMSKKRKTQTYDASQQTQEALPPLPEISSCMRQIRVEEKLTLSPILSDNVSQGVTEILTKRLMKYNDKLGGVIIAFSDIKIHDNPIILNNGHLLLTSHIVYLVFSPERGEIVFGEVVKVTDNSIACLVYNVFNASILITDDVKIIHKSNFNIGEIIKLRVEDINRTKDDILAITASLVHSTSIYNTDTPAVSHQLIQRKKRKINNE